MQIGGRDTRETIAALATPPGRSGVAVIRISGPASARIVRALTGRPPGTPRRAELRALNHPYTDELIDRGLVLWFPAPASFTGEDMAELQIHGGRAVISGLLDALTGPCGARLAEPGEFTRRAFDNGKLDLAMAEAMADLIAAETAAQRRLAGRQLAGALSEKADRWRELIIRASAYFEAAIDFPDEEVPADVMTRAAPLIRAARREIASALADRSGERLREGLTVALIGPPNAGKSTLLNALAKRDVAIVSEHAGTTRDAIEVALDLGGYPVVLVDTAGLRESVDPVEREGVRRSRSRAASADLRLLVWDIREAVDWRGLGVKPARDDLLVLAKSDLESGREEIADWPGGVVRLSAKTGQGMTELIAEIGARTERAMTSESPGIVTRLRHRRELEKAASALARVQETGLTHAELVAEELRSAARAIGRITGRVDVEDVLDVVFAEFCLGK